MAKNKDLREEQEDDEEMTVELDLEDGISYFSP